MAIHSSAAAPCRRTKQNSSINNSNSNSMVQYTLWIKATLENVTSLKWADGGDEEDDNQRRNSNSNNCTLLCCTVRHPTHPEMVREKIVVDFSELESSGAEDPISNPTTSRNSSSSAKNHHPKQKHSSSSSKHDHHHEKPHHFHVTWSDHSKGTIRVVQVNHYNNDSTKNKKNGSDDVLQSDEWYPLLTCECDNVEPVQWHPLGNELVVENRHGGTTLVDHLLLSTSTSSDGSSSSSLFSWSVHELSTGTTALRNVESKFE
jgi:hypothetical protein